LRHNAHVTRADMIEQRRKIARIVRRIGTPRRRARGRKAAVREGQAGIAATEMRHLLPPTQMIAPEPMREYEKWPRTVHFVIETAVGPVDVTALHEMILKNARAGPR
jgi:hypothetical protein